MLARALSATGTERARVLEIVQRRGPRRRARRAGAGRPPARREPACVAATEAFVAELKRPGEVEILQYRPIGPAAADPRDRHRPRRLARRRRRPAGRPVRARAPRRAALRRRRRGALDLRPDRRRGELPGHVTANLPPEPCVENARDAAPAYDSSCPCSRSLLVLPAAARAPTSPTAKTLYQDGPDGRYLLDGDWLFRLDNEDQGDQAALHAQHVDRRAGRTVKVPNVWNLGDASNESMSGGIGWYRKDFELPAADSALEWALRFESVNYRTRCGSTASRSARTPAPTSRSSSQLERPQAHAGRTGSWCAWTRAGSIATSRPRGLNTDGVPDRRLVELLRHPARGLPAQARHGRLPARPGAPGDRLRHLRRERAGADQPAQRHRRRPAGHDHRQVRRPHARPRQRRASGRTGSRRSRTRIRIDKPRLWSPQAPNLYDVSFTVRVGDRKVAGYTLHSGIRSIKVSNGRLVLNGQLLNTRGVGLHEDVQGRRLRDRQRAPRPARQRGQGARRDDAAHALPAAPVHARARRPARPADLVRDPGLLRQAPRSSRSRRCAGSRSRS